MSKMNELMKQDSERVMHTIIRISGDHSLRDYAAEHLVSKPLNECSEDEKRMVSELLYKKAPEILEEEREKGCCYVDSEFQAKLIMAIN